MDTECQGARDYWECQVCGTSAIHTPRKNSLEYACGRQCDWQIINQAEFLSVLNPSKDESATEGDSIADDLYKGMQLELND